MPVVVRKRGSQYCVVARDTGAVEKCYDSEEAADKYATALNMAHARKKGYIHNELPLEQDVIDELAEWKFDEGP